MRLIDADAAKNGIIKEISENLSGLDVRMFAISFALASMFDREDDLPTIDAEPVRHGRWTRSGENKYPIYNCSECKYPSSEKTNFCPNCGARIDGGKNINN